MHLKQPRITYIVCGPFKNLKNLDVEDVYVIKHLTLLKIQNMMNINVDLLQWSINFSIKKLQAEQLKNENISNNELAKEFHKPIIRKFNKRKVGSSFIDNIWGADPGDMQLIRKFIKDLDLYYVLLTFIVNMHWSFL